MGSSRQEYWSGLQCPPPEDLPDPGIRPGSPALQVDSLLSEPPGKPKKIGVGSLSLLQGIFKTQESNRGVPHCRRILYQMSPQGVLLTMSTTLFTKSRYTHTCASSAEKRRSGPRDRVLPGGAGSPGYQKDHGQQPGLSPSQHQ